MAADSEVPPAEEPPSTSADELASAGEAEEQPLPGPPANPLDFARMTFLSPREASAEESAPTMPVSSTAFKIKGLAAVFAVLCATGWVLDYSFSSDMFLAADEPAVNQGLAKYAPGAL